MEALRHSGASRKNIPTAEYESVMGRKRRSPLQMACKRRLRRLANGDHLRFDGKPRPNAISRIDGRAQINAQRQTGAVAQR